jgi:hypothetical protein
LNFALDEELTEGRFTLKPIEKKEAVFLLGKAPSNSAFFLADNNADRIIFMGELYFIIQKGEVKFHFSLVFGRNSPIFNLIATRHYNSR